VRKRKRRLVQKFFADRGPHLAAMIAYFALLSFVPLLFLALALLGLAGRADESSFLVTELKHAFPDTSVATLVQKVRDLQKHATALGIVGGVALIWTSMSLFSVLESAFNIVYGRPNRSFLRGKALAIGVMVGTLVTLFVGLLAGSIGIDVLRHYAPGVIGNAYVAYFLSIAVSLAAVFVFLGSVYYFLTNEEVTFREVLPGAVTAAVLLEASFQVVPLYVRYSSVSLALRAFGGPAILLVWLYFMANVIVFGAEVNWWRSRHVEEPLLEEAPGLA
jgi:membrane protein